jgi:hypothetical protein
MHDLELRGRALELIATGVNDCEVGRRLGVARTTVRHWRWDQERGAPPRALCWDIFGIFASTRAAVGLHPRQYRDRVRLCRRADVAQLVIHVGVKS